MVIYMKTIFVLNPVAGKGRGLDKIKEEIDQAAAKLGVEAGIYLTKSVGDAEKFAKLVCRETAEKGETIKLIACGGDGTVNEVLNGIMGFDCASMGVLPIGTGNDFVRNFPEAGDFLDIEAQLQCETVKCDVMEYTGLIAGEEQTRYCINMFNIGFDCNVVDLTADLKKYPLLNGSTAYMAAIAGVLIKKKGANLRVKIDGEIVQDGPILLTSIANGGFCGGGLNTVPMSKTDDGLMDVNIIYNMSRTSFLPKFIPYIKGTYQEAIKNVEKYIFLRPCKEVVVTPLDGVMRLCADGEISDAGEVTIKMLPKSVNILLPKKL